MAVKIAIAGTHSTGKTSLLESVREELVRKGYMVAKVGDLAIEARERGFPILREHTFSSTLWIMARGITLELEACVSADVVLVDRPVPDAYGYLQAALRHRNESLTQIETDYLEALVKQHVKTYQAIFKTDVDPSKPIGDDKCRDMDPIFRLQVAKELDSIFAKLNLPFAALGIRHQESHDQIMQQVEMCLRLRHQ